MTVTAMSVNARQDGKFVGDAAAEESVSELIEQAGRAAGLLALREAQLAAVHHGPQLRRAALDIAVALGIALAFLTAFVLANWAAVSALSGPLPGWAAPLLLAAAWIVTGIGLLVFVLSRGDRVFDWRQRRLLGADVEQRISARERARDDARRGMRESLERVIGEVENEAAVLAVVPTLLPARYFVSVARAALEGLGDELVPPGQLRQHGASRRNISGTDRRSAG